MENPKMKALRFTDPNLNFKKGSSSDSDVCSSLGNINFKTMIGTQETIQMEIINLYLCNFLKFIKDKFISCLAFFPKKKKSIISLDPKINWRAILVNQSLNMLQ